MNSHGVRTRFFGGVGCHEEYRAEEIIPKLREAEVLMSQGTTEELVAKQAGVSIQTLIRWRKEYGGLLMDQTKRMKELEK